LANAKLGKVCIGCSQCKTDRAIGQRVSR
jgi:hypothetical protein